MAGNMTLLICTDDARVDDCIGIISSAASSAPKSSPARPRWAWASRARCRWKSLSAARPSWSPMSSVLKSCDAGTSGGNDALKSELGAALRGGRLPHAVLLVGEPGCGAGFTRAAWRRITSTPGWPPRRGRAEKRGHRVPGLAGRGCQRADPGQKVREAREAIQRSALSTDAAGRVLFIYGAQNLNGTQGSAANALLKLLRSLRKVYCFF